MKHVQENFVSFISFLLNDVIRKMTLGWPCFTHYQMLAKYIFAIEDEHVSIANILMGNDDNV